MNSMPQQAVAKGRGQREFARAQATIVSSRVVNFVLKHPSVVTGGFGRELLAGAVEGAHADRLVPRDDASPKKRDGETSFGILLGLRADRLVRRVEKSRERDALLLALPRLRIHFVQKDPQRSENLRRGNSGSLVLAHRALETCQKR